MEYYSATKKNEIMPFAARWMDLEMIILSEVSQRQISYDITYMWNLIKMIQMNLFTKQKQSIICILIYKTETEYNQSQNQTYGYQRETWEEVIN